MHAAATFGDSGSKLTKLAIVTGLHVVLAIGLWNMKVLVVGPPVQPAPPVFPRLPRTPPPPIPEPDALPRAKLPALVIPETERVVIAPPDAVVTRKAEPKAEPEPSGEGEVDAKIARDGGGGGGTATEAKSKVFTAALANAKDCVLPEYPKNALRNGDVGTVSLALLIGINGEVTDSRVQQSSGFRELDRAAVAALRMCKFKPATSNGVAQPAWGQIAYVWRLD